ncbi:reductive dehalogenase [Dehalogenimonas sp. WBC-2]|nr:reductive dehalogenase [Dehalogenimonas sp. WBC-2]
MEVNHIQFHTTVDRRQYLKKIGVWAFGFHDEAFSVAQYHDFDEIITSEAFHASRLPWWVTELDYDNPTTEIDWTQAKRFDFRHLPQCSWQGAKELNAWAELRDGRDPTKRKQNEHNIRIKYSKQCFAKQRYNLSSKSLTSLLFGSSSGKYGSLNDGFFGPEVESPSDIGVKKWTGTLEEASTLLWQVCILLGASDVSLIELNPKTSRNLIASHEFHDGKPYVFEETEQAYETGENSTKRQPKDGKRVIPDRCRWLIHYSLSELESWPYHIFENSWLRYADARMLQYRIQAFIKGLGYQAIGPCSFTNNMSENVGMAVLGGEAELGRNNMAISPLLGSICGQYATIITDLPLAPTKPIDAGIRRFCHSCMSCALTCPGNAVSRGGIPTNEIQMEPSWEGFGPSHRWGNRSNFEKTTAGVYRQQEGKNEAAFYKHWYFSPSDCQLMNDQCGTWGCGTSCVFKNGVTGIARGC